MEEGTTKPETGSATIGPEGPARAEASPPGDGSLRYGARPTVRHPWAKSMYHVASGRARSLWRSLSVADYRRIWLSQLTSELGDWAARLALSIAVYQKSHSAALSALVVTVSVLPYAGFGQLIAALTENVSRKRVMIVADLFRAAVFLELCLPVPVWMYLLGAFAAGTATPAFDAARYSVKADITDDDALYGSALALSRFTEQGAIIAGFALGGVLVSAFGVRGALVVNAASFVASAALLSGLSLARRRTRRDGEATRARSPSLRAAATGRLSVGTRVLLGDPVLRWCTILGISVMAPTMAIEALTAAYGHGRPTTVALLAIAIPTGSLVMVAVAPHSGRPRRLLRAAALIPLFGGAVALGLFALFPSVPEAAVGFLAAGMAMSVTISAGPVMGRRLPPEVRGTSFSFLVGAGYLGGAVGSALGGLLADAAGAHFACCVACGVFVTVGVAMSLWLPNPKRPLSPGLLSSPAPKSPRAGRRTSPVSGAAS